MLESEKLELEELYNGSLELELSPSELLEDIKLEDELSPSELLEETKLEDEKSEELEEELPAESLHSQETTKNLMVPTQGSLPKSPPNIGFGAIVKLQDSRQRQNLSTTDFEVGSWQLPIE
jgi:hypothetical protein